MTAAATPNHEDETMDIEIPTILGTPLAGGFYACRYQINGDEYALIVAPKAFGERDDIIWNSSSADIEGAKSYCDGLINTKAMAEAGSDIAKWALGLDINGIADWYLPALDELELLYRAFKPSDDKNSCWARAGINLSALLPTWPYTLDFPMQTTIETFCAGAPEAFAREVYWSSTQHAADSGYAWVQYFGNGGQDFWFKNYTCRARAVRRIKI